MTFNAYIKEIMPIPLENIEVSPSNPYMYRITAFSSLVNENRSIIDKILGKNNRISSYEGWFGKPKDCFFKQALIEFKKGDKKKMLKILDFYAPWCGQCRKLMPIIDEIAKEYPNIEVEKISSEDNMELAQSYNVSGLPCILFVRGEKVIDRINGMTTKSKIVDKIEKLI